MKSLKLDKNNNLIIDGDIAIIKNNEALSQDIKSMLSLNKGEYLYNVNMGIDYLNYFQKKDKLFLLYQFENELYTDERVASISIDTNEANKNLLIDITTTGGDNVNISMEQNGQRA